MNNKTRKKSKKHHCIAVLNMNKIYGIIKFYSHNSTKIKIKYDITGLTDGLHGFHIHKCGDMSDSCSSACSHFNPTNSEHGGLNSKTRHAGDLGNIKSHNNKCKGTLYAPTLSIDPTSLYSIIGRAIIVHEDEDDLGLGSNEESKKTGNAGKRLACGIIGITGGSPF